jgi:hypothetical protein
MGYLDRTKVPVSIDIGFGDIIYPERMKMEFPVLLDMEVPEVYAYSIYSVIAENLKPLFLLDLPMVDIRISMISMFWRIDIILMEQNSRTQSSRPSLTEKLDLMIL